MYEFMKKKVKITGDRIYLRTITISDVNKNYLQWMNDKEIVKYLESRFTNYSMEDLIDYVIKTTSNSDILFLAIISKEENKHIGNIKLGPINRMHLFANMGIIIGEKNYWGKGYATEAIKIVVDYAFNKLNLHKITAGVYVENTRSKKVFLKAGFKKEGILKKHYFYNGKYIDAIILGVINERFIFKTPSQS